MGYDFTATEEDLVDELEYYLGYELDTVSAFVYALQEGEYVGGCEDILGIKVTEVDDDAV